MSPGAPRILCGVDLSGLSPDDVADLESLHDWRAGPWFRRGERWDLVPVARLGLDRDFEADLVVAGFVTAGLLAEALTRDRAPACLRDPGRRQAARLAIRARAVVADREVALIRADLATLVDAMRRRRAKQEARPGLASGAGS